MRERKSNVTTAGSNLQTIEVPIQGMDCTECTQHVQKAVQALSGVQEANVFLSSEKAVIKFDPRQVNLEDIRRAVAGAGYSVPDPKEKEAGKGIGDEAAPAARGFTRQILTLLGVAFGLILFIVVVGEWFGLFEAVTTHVPLPIGI